MGESGAPRTFIAGADVVPHVRGDDGDGPILVDDEGEPVGEGVDGDGDAEGGALGAEGAGEEGEE